MPERDVQIQSDALVSAVRRRLYGELATQAGPLVWTDGDADVVVHPDSLRIRLTRGWLVAVVDLESAETGRKAMELTFFMGRQGEGSGPSASSRTATDDASGLLLRWAPALEAAVWSGALDAMGAAARGLQAPGTRTMVAGFFSAEGVLNVSLGER